MGRGDDPFLPRYERACEVDYCSGAALLVRRASFERLGGYDARYAPAYHEDTDLCFGLRSLGQKVVYCPRSVVVHFGGATAGPPARGWAGAARSRPATDGASWWSIRSCRCTTGGGGRRPSGAPGAGASLNAARPV